MDGNQSQIDLDNAWLAASLASFALGVRVEDVMTSGRGRPSISFARHVAMYLCHVALGMSLARIARAFDKDRSTVAHGCHQVEDRREDADFHGWMEQLEDGLRGVSGLYSSCVA